MTRDGNNEGLGEKGATSEQELQIQGKDNYAPQRRQQYDWIKTDVPRYNHSSTKLGERVVLQTVTEI